MSLHHDLDVLSERHEEAHQTLDGELAEVAVQHLGDVGLLHAEQPGSLDLPQTARAHQGIDLQDKLCLYQVLIGAGEANVGEDIAAALHVLNGCQQPKR